MPSPTLCDGSDWPNPCRTTSLLACAIPVVRRGVCRSVAVSAEGNAGGNVEDDDDVDAYDAPETDQQRLAKAAYLRSQLRSLEAAMWDSEGADGGGAGGVLAKLGPLRHLAKALALVSGSRSSARHAHTALAHGLG